MTQQNQSSTMKEFLSVGLIVGYRCDKQACEKMTPPKVISGREMIKSLSKGKTRSQNSSTR